MMACIGRLHDAEIVADMNATIEHVKHLSGARRQDRREGRLHGRARELSDGRLEREPARGRCVLRREHHEAVGRRPGALRAHVEDRVLVSHGFTVALLNPLRTHRFAGEDLVRTKTAAIDAVRDLGSELAV